MTIDQWLRQAANRLAGAGISSASLDSQLIAASVVGRDRTAIISHGDKRLSGDELRMAEARLDLRLKRRPLAQILGKREFYGLDFVVTPDVLIPRVETERIVDLAIEYAPHNGSLLDMGTGCGGLAIAIAKHRPDLAITASDISNQALEVAKRNANLHSTAVNFINSNLWGSIAGRFDCVVTNLPYLSAEAMASLTPEAQSEPSVALDGGLDGLDLYRRFLTDLPSHLNQSGFIFTESDPWQQPTLIAAAKRVGLRPIVENYFVTGFMNGPIQSVTDST
jgi:release factor glutamine methyltransferase